jgi:hypothetical protein
LPKNTREVASEADILPFPKSEPNKPKPEVIRRIIKSYSSKTRILTNFENLPDSVFVHFYNNWEVDVCPKVDA